MNKLINAIFMINESSLYSVIVFTYLKI